MNALGGPESRAQAPRDAPPPELILAVNTAATQGQVGAARRTPARRGV
jgi:hypothetical protein